MGLDIIDTIGWAAGIGSGHNGWATIMTRWPPGRPATHAFVISGKAATLPFHTRCRNRTMVFKKRTLVFAKETMVFIKRTMCSNKKPSWLCIHKKNHCVQKQNQLHSFFDSYLILSIENSCAGHNLNLISFRRLFKF